MEKKNIFIFANLYNVKTILFEINYMLSINIGKIILLKEVYEYNDNFKKYNIEVCDDIESCIQKCHFVLVIKDNNIPNTSLNRILNRSIYYNKPYYLINNLTCNDTSEHIESTKNKINQDIPTLLCLALGEYTQQLYIELLLNKIFTDLSITINQFYSKSTNNLMRELYNKKLLNLELAKHLTDRRVVPGLLNVVAVNLSSRATLPEISSVVRIISPDYIVILLDECIEQPECHKLQNLVYFNCFKEINLYIKTHYHYNDSSAPYILYRRDLNINASKNVDIESSNVSCILRESILSNISIPEGMEIL